MKDVCHEYQRFHWWRHQIKTSQISRNMWKRGRFLWSLFHYFTRPWQSPCDVNYVKMALNFRSRQIVFLHLHHSVIISHIVTIDKNTKSGSFWSLALASLSLVLSSVRSYYSSNNHYSLACLQVLERVRNWERFQTNLETPHFKNGKSLLSRWHFFCFEISY